MSGHFVLPELRAYLDRRGVREPWSVETVHGGPFTGGIVIPALAEAGTLPILLDSLAADPTLPGSGLLVLFVVNNRADASGPEREDNAASLQFLRAYAARARFPIALIDAASPGLELPAKDGGVGLARKVGHDLLLPLLDYAGNEPFIASLDADTTASPGYAGALVSHFRSTGAGGAVIPFVHRPGNSDAENLAIERYELFLRCYVAGLCHAGSPYGFQTVGSAMACTATAYVKCGGMNRRRAGEDFYFLQSLAKTSGVERLRGTTVFPSPRRSYRVPFGTGRAVGAILDGERDAVLFYRPESFHLLREWLSLATEGCRTRQAGLPDLAGGLSPFLGQFLEEQGFASAWDGLLRHNRKEGQLTAAFHRWFDAFRTMKLFHFLAAGPCPRQEPEEVLHLWPEVWGEPELSPPERLALLRLRENSYLK